jgi:hypothetical protein
MKGDNLISGLIRRRRELGRDVAGHLAEIERLRLDIDALDRVLLLWRPEMDLGAIQPLGSNHVEGLKRHALSRCILAALRFAGEPISLTDLTRQVMAARGSAGDAVDAQREAVRRSLAKLKAAGQVMSVQDGGRLFWSTAQ